MLTFARFDVVWQLQLVADHAEGPVTRARALVGVAVGGSRFIFAIRPVPLTHHLVRRRCT